jgi:hypothetical protein
MDDASANRELGDLSDAVPGIVRASRTSGRTSANCSHSRRVGTLTPSWRDAHVHRVQVLGLSDKGEFIRACVSCV